PLLPRPHRGSGDPGGHHGLYRKGGCQMTGLIYKDFLALKGHLSTYVVFFVIYGGLCIAGVFSPSVLAGMVVLISIITPMTTVTSDDMSRWNRFAVASPACRRGVV